MLQAFPTDSSRTFSTLMKGMIREALSVRAALCIQPEDEIARDGFHDGDLFGVDGYDDPSTTGKDLDKSRPHPEDAPPLPGILANGPQQGVTQLHSLGIIQADNLVTNDQCGHAPNFLELEA